MFSPPTQRRHYKQPVVIIDSMLPHTTNDNVLILLTVFPAQRDLQLDLQYQLVRCVCVVVYVCSVCGSVWVLVCSCVFVHSFMYVCPVVHQWVPGINWGGQCQLSMSHTVGEGPGGTLGAHIFICEI